MCNKLEVFLLHNLQTPTELIQYINEARITCLRGYFYPCISRKCTTMHYQPISDIFAGSCVHEIGPCNSIFDRNNFHSATSTPAEITATTMRPIALE
jgi:hypothetical protein